MVINSRITEKDASRLRKGELVKCGPFHYTVEENCEEDGKVTIRDGFGGIAVYKYGDFPHYGFTREFTVSSLV